MVTSKAQPVPTCTIQTGSEPLEQVSSSNYFGSLVTADGRCKNKIKRRIALAKEAFNKMRSLLTDRKLSILVKVRLLKTFVWSVLLYGYESWTWTAETRNNIQAAEMWFYRRMFRISYVDRMTDAEVLKKVGQERQLLKMIERRQWKFFGHSIRKGSLEELALSGKIPGK